MNVFDGFSDSWVGIMEMPNGFVNWLVWMLIGAAAFVQWFIGNLMLSYKALVIENLERIADKQN